MCKWFKKLYSRISYLLSFYGFQYYLAPDIDVENGIEGDGEECESEEEEEEEDGADDGDEGGEGEEGDDSIVVVEDDVDEDDDEEEAVNDEDDGVNEEDDLLVDDEVDREGKHSTTNCVYCCIAWCYKEVDF